jgi:hypothetical protein
VGARSDFDPATGLAGETEAHRMPHSGLDDEQRASLRPLVDAGVIDA